MKDDTCLCGAQLNAHHAPDCPYACYPDAGIEPERQWFADRDALRASMRSGGAYVRRWTFAPVAYDSWGAWTAATIAVVKRSRAGEKAELREVYIPKGHVQWHEDRWASGLYPWYTDATLAEAEHYGDFKRIIPAAQ